MFSSIRTKFRALRNSLRNAIETGDLSCGIDSLQGISRLDLQNQSTFSEYLLLLGFNHLKSSLKITKGLQVGGLEVSSDLSIERTQSEINVFESSAVKTIIKSPDTEGALRSFGTLLSVFSLSSRSFKFDKYTLLLPAMG